MRGLLALLGSILIRALYATLRVRHIGAGHLEGQPRHIVTFWHAHLLMMLHCRFRRPMAVLTSQSRDGDLITGVFDYYGVESARGSSTRGGSAGFREMIRMAREGYNLTFTPDGPKGPPRRVKEGVIAAAQLTGLPIIPVAFAAKKKSCSHRGTGWSFPIRSRRRSSSTANRYEFRAMGRSKFGVRGWSGP